MDISYKANMAWAYAAFVDSKTLDMAECVITSASVDTPPCFMPPDVVGIKSCLVDDKIIEE